MHVFKYKNETLEEEMYFQKVTAAAKLTNCLGCRMENTFGDKQGCQGNINSGLLCKGIMVQSLITKPNPGFPLLLSYPSFSGVPKPILGEESAHCRAVVTQAAHHIITSITEIPFHMLPI